MIVADGLHASELLSQMGPPALVICDVMMPRVDGFRGEGDRARRCRSWSSGSRTRHTAQVRERRDRPPGPTAPIGARPLLGPWLAFAGAALSGVLYWASFAGMDLWPFAFVAFGPLWIALHGQTPKRAFVLGTITGTTMNVLGFYWLLDMLQTFSGFPTAACMFFLLVVCAYQGTRVGAMGWLYARAAARGWPAVPVLLGAFVASELAYPLLFPWYFAATVHQVPALLQVAELGGVVLVGLVLLGANLALFEPILARLERRKLDRIPVVAGGAAGLVLTLAYGAVRIPSVDARRRPRPSR